ncbi:MAG TPA: DUF2339 domain-containing protein, partial [Acidobacteriaceae bacterium]|nr:DUF2339 domain-containing protein [Acidobacteriaceae bacterium]
MAIGEESAGTDGAQGGDRTESSLEQRVARLEAELDALQRRVVSAPQAAPAMPRPSFIAPPPPLIVPAKQVPAADPDRATGPRFAEFHAPTPVADGGGLHSFENRLGSQIFNRVAIVLLLIGTAYGLKLAVDRGWIGPPERVLVGLAAGAGLVVWSERFRARGFAAFSYSLKAVGSGVLYLSLWAAF